MKTSLPILTAALLLFGPSVIATAQDRQPSLTIDIGGISLQLGMPQAETLERLVGVYDVRHQDSTPGTWTVTRKGGPPYELLGSLSFRQQRLAFASRAWGSAPASQTGNGLALAVHNALKSVSTGKPRTCAVSTEATGVVVATILQCGRRRFSILASSDGTTDGSVGESVSIDW